MGRAHFARLYRHHDPYLVIHPACDAAVHAFAASQPPSSVGRIKIGKRHHGYAAEDAPLLLRYFKGSGHWVCGVCREAFRNRSAPPCTEMVWDAEWLQTVGMARFETMAEWEKIFESVADSFTFRSNPPLPLKVHEDLLGITPPYDRDGVLKAFRVAAMKAHPDRGGSDQAMRRVIEARDALLPALG